MFLRMVFEDAAADHNRGDDDDDDDDDDAFACNAKQ